MSNRIDTRGGPALDAGGVPGCDGGVLGGSVARWSERKRKERDVLVDLYF